jgi:hypothetical protein
MRAPKDLWTGLIYVGFGLSAVLIARDYGMGTALKMGPAYFPTILGSLLILIGLMALVRSLLFAGPPVGAFALRGLVLVIGAVVLFGLLVRGAGLAIALPVLVLGSASASVHFRWLPSLSVALALTVFCVVIFLKGLGIPLPIVGPWFGR